MKAWLYHGKVGGFDLNSIHLTEAEARDAAEDTNLEDDFDWAEAAEVEVPIPNQVTEALKRLMNLLDRDDVRISDEVAEEIIAADTQIREALNL